MDSLCDKSYHTKSSTFNISVFTGAHFVDKHVTVSLYNYCEAVAKSLQGIYSFVL